MRVLKDIVSHFAEPNYQRKAYTRQGFETLAPNFLPPTKPKQLQSSSFHKPWSICRMNSTAHKTKWDQNLMMWTQKMDQLLNYCTCSLFLFREINSPPRIHQKRLNLKKICSAFGASPRIDINLEWTFGLEGITSPSFDHFPLEHQQECM